MGPSRLSLTCLLTITAAASAIPIEKRARRLVLTMRVPRSGLQAQESLALLEAACNLVDALELQHARLTNSAVAKLRNARVAIDKELNEEATRWRKEEVRVG